jgi:hypothetical protein
VGTVWGGVDFPSKRTCFLAAKISVAACFAAAGVSFATALYNISSSVSIMSAATDLSPKSDSSESDIIATGARVVLATFLWDTLSTCSWCRNFTHFEFPSKSSTFFNLLRAPSTYVLS